MEIQSVRRTEKKVYNISLDEFKDHIKEETTRLEMTFDTDGLCVEISTRTLKEHEESCDCGWTQKYSHKRLRYGGGCYGSVKAVPDWLRTIIRGHSPNWWRNTGIAYDLNCH